MHMKLNINTHAHTPTQSETLDQYAVEKHHQNSSSSQYLLRMGTDAPPSPLPSFQAAPNSGSSPALVSWDEVGLYPRLNLGDDPGLVSLAGRGGEATAATPLTL